MNYRSLYKLYKHKKTYELFEKTKKIPVLVGSWDKTKAITLPKKNVGIFSYLVVLLIQAITLHVPVNNANSSYMHNNFSA